MPKEVILRNGSKAVQTIKEGRYKNTPQNRKLNRVGKKYQIKMLKIVGRGYKPQAGGVVGAIVSAIGSIVPGILEFVNNMIKPKQETAEEREERIRKVVGHERWTRLSSGKYVLQDPYTQKIYLSPETGEPFVITGTQWQKIRDLENEKTDQSQFYTV